VCAQEEVKKGKANNKIKIKRSRLVSNIVCHTFILHRTEIDSLFSFNPSLGLPIFFVPFFLKKIVFSLATTTRRGRGRRRSGRRRGRWSGFFFIRTRFIQANVEVFDDISASVCCNNAEEITHLVLLEETLCQILEIPLGKCNCASNLNLGLVIGDFDMISQLASLTIDFDPFLQVRR